MTAERPLRGLTLYPEYANLIALRAKVAETRPGPPAGSMCPVGLRPGVGGFGIEPHDRIAVIAGARKRRIGVHELGPWSIESSRGSEGMLLRGPIAWPYRMPTRSVVATARVFGAWPSERVGFDPLLEEDERGWRIDGDRLWLRPSEEPLGDFSPGRWVLPLYEVQRIEPIRQKGGQGFIELPQKVTDRVEGLACGVTARSIWEHCRTGTDMASLLARLPGWSEPWFHDVAADLTASFERAMTEISEATPGPGPYEAHLADLAAGLQFKAEQRVWAQLRPRAELPARVHVEA